MSRFFKVPKGVSWDQTISWQRANWKSINILCGSLFVDPTSFSARWHTIYLFVILRGWMHTLHTISLGVWPYLCKSGTAFVWQWMRTLLIFTHKDNVISDNFVTAHGITSDSCMPRKKLRSDIFFTCNYICCFRLCNSGAVFVWPWMRTLLFFYSQGQCGIRQSRDNTRNK